MTVLIIGAVLLAAILGLFHMKDRLESPLLARWAYSEIVARLAVVAAVLILVGLLMIGAELIGFSPRADYS
ncbi:MAG: hypothetical protein OXR84_01200 [Magnetovibrio sp.]|nr:hypothetical protein [Magnetovibrio sp.]